MKLMINIENNNLLNDNEENQNVDVAFYGDVAIENHNSGNLNKLLNDKIDNDNPSQLNSP